MAFKFLVYVDSCGRADLCEGGVYTDDSAIRATAEDYADYDFAMAESHRAEHINGAGIGAWESASGAKGRNPYELRDSMAGVDASDPIVLESLVDWQKAAIRDDSAVPMGFYEGRTYNGNRCFAAFWPDAEKLMRHDRRLGSRRQLESCRKGEGTMRVGYETVAHIFGARGADQWTPVELKPCEGMTYEGETVAHNGGHYVSHYVGIVPARQPSRHYCGGEVQATIYLAGYDSFERLPFTRIAYISRDNDGRLHVAIPG